MHEYGMKLTQLCRYALEIVKDIRSKVSLFVARFGRASRQKDRAAMFIGDMDISRFMVYVQKS